jgi:hypothetical protein
VTSGLPSKLNVIPRAPQLGAQQQIAGGGRYAEGIGWAIGLDRLLLALEGR